MKVNNSVNYECFVFPNNVEQVECFVGETEAKATCKKITIDTEAYNLRIKLKELYNIDTVSMQILDKNKIFVATSNYKDIRDIPDMKTNNKEVINALKMYVFPLATSTMLNINAELSHLAHNGKTHKESAKVRNKRKLSERLQEILKAQYRD